MKGPCKPHQFIEKSTLRVTTFRGRVRWLQCETCGFEEWLPIEDVETDLGKST